MNIDRAKEIIQMQKEMLAEVERGEAHPDDDFQDRFLLLADEFLRAVREPG